VNSIYILCPDDNRPVGGIKALYRHADILVRHGYNASIIHRKKGFRCTWFENDTRVDYIHRINPDTFDFVVIPEVNGPRAAEIFPDAKKIIFNQNAYYTFTGYSLDPRERDTAYTNPNLLSVIVVSEDSRAYLAHAFPHLKICRIHKSVDGARFRPKALADKKLRISFMARKHPEELRQVLNILKFRNMLDGVEIVTIVGKPENEVAEILADSLIFVSFGYPKGLPSAPMEAMLCGCLAVGYHGMGGREYYTPDIAWPVPVGDVVGVAKAVEEVLRLYHTDRAALQQKADAARAYIAREYSPEREQNDILKFWDDLMYDQGRDAIAES
jgi:glycosyltransferase involved in cell wall biosynthesis